MWRSRGGGVESAVRRHRTRLDSSHSLPSASSAHSDPDGLLPCCLRIRRCQLQSGGDQAVSPQSASPCEPVIVRRQSHFEARHRATPRVSPDHWRGAVAIGCVVGAVARLAYSGRDYMYVSLYHSLEPRIAVHTRSIIWHEQWEKSDHRGWLALFYILIQPLHKLSCVM